MPAISLLRLIIQVDSHLRIRSIAERDAREVFQLVENNRAYLREWLPWVDGTRTIKDIITFARLARKECTIGRAFHGVIELDGRIVGVIGYNLINWAHRFTQIGYWLDSGHQGQGIMRRSCRALVQQAFEYLQVNRVEIRAAIGNLPSRRVMESLGFSEEGVIREAEWLYDHFVDLVSYSMLASEWKERLPEI